MERPGQDVAEERTERDVIGARRVGVTSGIRRYPVKSMRGETLASATISERGILGDRVWAVVESDTGRIASAKQPRTWRSLLECAPSFRTTPSHDLPAPSVEIAMPDGRIIVNDSASFDADLSAFLGRDVSLISRAPENARRETVRVAIEGVNDRERVSDEPFALASPAGTFFDYATIHIMTTSTLSCLATLYPEGCFDIERFRPNIIVETDGDGFVENDWIGHEIAIGDEVRLRIIDPSPRCVITTLAQNGLPADPGILRTIARHNAAASATAAPGMTMRAVAGVYASVVRGGLISAGDPVFVE